MCVFASTWKWNELKTATVEVFAWIHSSCTYANVEVTETPDNLEKIHNFFF